MSSKKSDVVAVGFSASPTQRLDALSPVDNASKVSRTHLKDLTSADETIRCASKQVRFAESYNIFYEPITTEGSTMTHEERISMHMSEDELLTVKEELKDDLRALKKLCKEGDMDAIGYVRAIDETVKMAKILKGEISSDQTTADIGKRLALEPVSVRGCEKFFRKKMLNDRAHAARQKIYSIVQDDQFKTLPEKKQRRLIQNVTKFHAKWAQVIAHYDHLAVAQKNRG